MNLVNRLFRACLAASLVAWVASSAHAATVARVSISEMLQASEFVFQGTVLSREAVEVGKRGSIVTRVRFQVLDVIKGRRNLRTIDLDFAGGTVNGLTLSIAEMNVPNVGDEGVYFVESLQRRQVHPFYGWDQGHFSVRHEARGKVIYTADLRPVYDLQAGPSARLTEFSAGTANGVVTESSGLQRQVMTLATFKSRLRGMESRR